MGNQYNIIKCVHPSKVFWSKQLPEIKTKQNKTKQNKQTNKQKRHTYKYCSLSVKLRELDFPRISQSLGFPRWCSGKESACQCRRYRRCEFHSQVRKIPWRRKCNPSQYSCLENPMDTGVWWAQSIGSQRVGLN